MRTIEEKIQIGQAFNPEAILTISEEDLYKLSEEEVKKYFQFLIDEFDKDTNIDNVPEVNGKLVSNGEEWD